MLEDFVGQRLGQFTKAKGIEPGCLVPGADIIPEQMIRLCGLIDGRLALVAPLDLVDDLPALPGWEKLAGYAGVGLAPLSSGSLS